MNTLRNELGNELGNKYILMILNCKKYYYKRYKQINNFLNNKILRGIKYFHVIGDKSKCNNKEYFIDRNANIIYTNTEDDYLSLPHKTICCMKALLENFNFEYILKTDDDQNLVVRHFFLLLDQQIEKKRREKQNIDYFGNLSIVKPHISHNYKIHKEDNFPDNYIVGDHNVFSNGRFYGLSRRNAKDLVENKFDLIKKELCEDWAIAKYQNKDWRNNYFNISTNKIFKDRPESSLIVKYKKI